MALKKYMQVTGIFSEVPVLILFLESFFLHKPLRVSFLSLFFFFFDHNMISLKIYVGYIGSDIAGKRP
jgi:hypothetical protein